MPKGYCDECLGYCIRRIDLEERIEEVGGLSFFSPHGKSKKIDFDPQGVLDTLPWHLYRLRRAIKVYAGLRAEDVGGWVTLTARDITIASNGGVMTPNKTLHEVLEIDPKIKILLTGFAKDDILEKVWHKMTRESFEQYFQTLKDIGISALVSYYYSTYANSPRIEHLYNYKRLIYFTEFAASCGLSVIPLVDWTHQDDRIRWVEWLVERRPPWLCFSLQDLSYTERLAELNKDADLCLELASYGYRPRVVIVGGHNSLRNMKAFYRIFLASGAAEKVSLICNTPGVMAISFYYLDYSPRGGVQLKKSDSNNRLALFLKSARNVEYASWLAHESALRHYTMF
ncbi:MAG: DUF4417 domain-containing protein [Candidatus Hadarchaeales archaeon]